MLICLLSPLPAHAQYDNTTAPETSLSPLQRLDLFQKSVKRRIKTAFSRSEDDLVEPVSDAAARYPNESNEFGRQVRQASQQELSWQAPDPISRQVNSDVAGTAGFQQQYDQQVSPSSGTLPPLPEPILNHPSQGVASSQGFASGQGLAPGEAYMHSTRSPGQNPGQTSSGPTQPPAPSQPAGATHLPSQRPATHPANHQLPTPSTAPPLVHGTLLGQPQMTATQHALRLIEENGDLKARLAAITAENARLKDRLLQTQDLLTRSNEAVAAAKTEIDTLSIRNKTLSQRLREAEDQHNKHLLETDRMLHSIRQELDDVLVREISSGNR